jgi:hypothetical protein
LHLGSEDESHVGVAAGVQDGQRGGVGDGGAERVGGGLGGGEDQGDAGFASDAQQRDGRGRCCVDRVQADVAALAL